MSDYSELKRLADAALNDNGDYVALSDYGMAVPPAVVLDLIAELEEARNGMKHSCAIRLKKEIERLEAESDQLKAEVEALRKDKDRLDALEANFWDVRHTSTQVGMEGDTSQSIEIVGSWMDAPRERVIGENYSENLRAAIDQAMTSDAYPPARPEYEEDDL